MPRIHALPGVEQAAVIDRLPFAPSTAVSRFTLEGQPSEPGKERIAQLRGVDHQFLEMMRMPLRSGRLFDEADLGNQRNEVIINETMARSFSPNQDPIGKHIRMDWGVQLLIIGVIADIKGPGAGRPGRT